MDIIERNFTDNKVEVFLALVRGILKEFPILDKKYDEMIILLANSNQEKEVELKRHHFLNPDADNKVGISFEEDYTQRYPMARGEIYKEKCSIWLVLDKLIEITEEEQKYVIRHEFCHLTLQHSTQELQEELCLMIPSRPYSVVFCSTSCRDYFWESEAELLLLKKFPDYRKTRTFEILYKKHLAVSRKGLEEWWRKWINIPDKTLRFREGIVTCLKILKVIKIFNYYIQNFESSDNTLIRKQVKYLQKKNLRQFYDKMEIDFPTTVKRHLNQEIFEKDKHFFINNILDLLDKIAYDAWEDNRRKK